MNIVRITSGLGNQMFQYAFYRALKENNPHTKMDISEFTYRRHHNGYELDRIFSIDPDYADKKECDAMADLSKDFFSEFRRKVLKIKKKMSTTLIREDEIGTFYHPELLKMDHCYFQGFWQTEAYFSAIRHLIRADFTFKNRLDAKNQLLLESIAVCQSVSIHVRRGDYVKKRRRESFGSVCTPEYYLQAIDYIEKEIENPVFFVFSDDIPWVRENMNIRHAQYIDWNNGADSYKDMQLMSNCRHHIIANSSFSWWGAWLNPRPKKIVVAPSVWFRDADMPDIIPPEWVTIEVD